MRTYDEMTLGRETLRKLAFCEGCNKKVELSPMDIKILLDYVDKALAADQRPRVAYLCDGTACEGCVSGMFRECIRTSDIDHAVNFKKDPGGIYFEQTIRDCIEGEYDEVLVEYNSEALELAAAIDQRITSITRLFEEGKLIEESIYFDEYFNCGRDCEDDGEPE